MAIIVNPLVETDTGGARAGGKGVRGSRESSPSERDSLYESGKRSGAWLKYRINKGQEFVIGGYVPNNPIDSIIVGYYEDGKLLYAGKVRNGFVPHTRRAVAAKFTGLKTDTCPFANLPEKKRTQWALTAEEMKNCRWRKPELVIGAVQRSNSSRVQGPPDPYLVIRADRVRRMDPPTST